MLDRLRRADVLSLAPVQRIRSGMASETGRPEKLSGRLLALSKLQEKLGGAPVLPLMETGTEALADQAA